MGINWPVRPPPPSHLPQPSLETLINKNNTQPLATRTPSIPLPNSTVPQLITTTRISPLFSRTIRTPALFQQQGHSHHQL